MAGIDLDFSEFDEFTARFEKLPAETVKNVRTAVEVSARAVKDDARSRASKIGGHARHYPRSIHYTMLGSKDAITAEIGPEDMGGRQGPLGPLLEDGTPTSAPHPHLKPALQDVKEDFERGLQKAVTDGLEAL